MNTPVSFELAKLLKEKGFDEPCSHAYKEAESPVLYIHQDKKYNNSFKKEWQNTMRKNSHMDNAIINRYSAPTIAEVVMWLYEKHGIWIANNYQLGRKTFLYELIDINSHENTILIQENNYKDVGEVEFNSPTEAYEAAIKHCLEKNYLMCI